MRRGFKAEAEALATDVRTKLGCKPDEPAPLVELGRHLGVEIVPADRFVARSRLLELHRIQPDAFSAGTFRRPTGGFVVVYNPLHAKGRTRSDQAHELAHILLGHSVRTLEQVGNLRFFTCDVKQEEEADWLGGCLLLPRGLLLKAAKAGMTATAIADKYGTSEPMARFRLNASGVLIQVGHARAASKRQNR